MDAKAIKAKFPDAVQDETNPEKWNLPDGTWILVGQSMVDALLADQDLSNLVEVRKQSTH